MICVGDIQATPSSGTASAATPPTGCRAAANVPPSDCVAAVIVSKW